MIVLCTNCGRRRRDVAAVGGSMLGCVRTSSGSAVDEAQYEAVTPAMDAPTYEEITTPVERTTSVGLHYSRDKRDELERATAEPPSSSSSSAAAAAAAVMSTATGESLTYSGASTTLIDNALYDAQQPVTSSDVAETVDDVTDEREGQGRSGCGSADYECTTLVDNDLYRY